ncbi:MAG TPA: hypothetical protein DDX98_02075 [Bacteroidales bacterium]|jgi:hypothetical protein|nr:hypothetical protein [Bacteroidales bacterium]
MGFFRLLLIFFLVYFAVRLIRSIFRPRASQRNYQYKQSQRREGDVSIKVDPSKKTKKVSKDEGDYIDYEEA